MDETDRELIQEDDTPTDDHKVPLESSKVVQEDPMPAQVESEEVEESAAHDISNEEDGHSIHSDSDVSDRSPMESGDEVDNEEEDDASVILEREEGDGQESTPNRKVDDDEDKRNPQYIPKRGTFYEHDDRTAVEEEAEGEGEEAEVKEKVEKEVTKKKVWSEKESSRWSHDRFNDTEQAPKSRVELVSIYGYDIRNEEGPPRARRRRRYGRGPNKYTRNWEDEDAYNKMQVPSVRGTGRKPRPKGEDFPPLEGSRRHQSQSSDKSDVAASGDSEHNKEGSVSSQDNGNRVEMSKVDPIPSPPPPQSVQKPEPQTRNENGNYPKLPKQPMPNKPIRDQREQRDQRDNRTISRTVKPSLRNEDSSRGISHMRGVTRTRGFRGTGRGDNRTRAQPPPQKPMQEENDYIVSQNFTNKSINHQVIQDVEKEMSNMSIQEGGYSRGGKFNGPRQASVPPRLQAEQRGSKRYSSLRQRSLPETAAQQNFNQQHPVIHYTTEYAQQNQPQSTSGILPHPAPIPQVPPTSQPLMPPPAQPMPLPHQAANGAGILQPPITAQYANYPQGPAFIQAGVAPPAFIPQQGINGPPQIINYQPPPQFPQPDFAGFQHQQFAAVNQPPPADVYQAQQGGITYYSMQSQQVIPRVQAKRPKAAIPIVPPPEHKEPRGRGRLNQGEDSPVGGTPDMKEYEMENGGMQYGADVAVQQ